MDLLTYVALKSEINSLVTDGVKGEPGKSAYEVAVDEGFEGTQQDWLASLVGPPGPAALIDIVKINNIALEINPDDKSINIPVARNSNLGVVKGSTNDNMVSVNETGEMEVNSLDVKKMYQEEGDVLIFNCGTSKT